MTTAEADPRRLPAMRALLAIAAAATLAACSVVRGPAIPVWHRLHEAPAGPASGLVVMLPGIGDTGEDFVRNDMVARIHAVAPHLDVATVDANLGYHVRGILAERVHQDVIQPRRDRYREIWIVGISLGGLGATTYAASYPHVVDGVLLLAPFLGEDDVVDEVARAGGVRSWSAPELDRFANPMRRLTHRAWSWAREVAEGTGDQPVVLLGYGRHDRYARAHGMLAEALPAGSVATVDGAHDWQAWRDLFDVLLPLAFGEAPSDRGRERFAP
ncbi:MAG: alpha/beta fold hydrolase [Planctomycetota bacterium]